MSEDSGQEKTEDPTPKRQEQAKEKGQVARSRELNTMLVLFSAVMAASILGSSMGKGLMEVISKLLSVSRENVFNPAAMMNSLSSAILDTLNIISPFFTVMVVAAILGPISLGGVNFSTKALAFKMEKLDPIKGTKRIFAIRGLVELVKALAKFMIIGTVALSFLYLNRNDLILLGSIPLEKGINNAISLMLWAFLSLSSALIIVAFVDVPFQLWDHKKQIKMTRQEVKDDSKDSEGNPEVRGHVRQLQREMAQRRMMEDVPDADVVITNPEHYSVALKYDPASPKAPIVLAKGADLVAFRIRTVANEHNVVILEAPPLARSIYYTTEIKDEIPAGLFLAVAQILAYVYQLKKKTYGESGAPKQPDISIPDDLQFDS
ncbi:MAG: flagellar biosynthesis protein FlhB [Gammaproteobacteria bacterium]